MSMIADARILAAKAANAAVSDEAQRFGQAALNVAHAANIIAALEPAREKPGSSKEIADAWLSGKI